MIKIIFCILLFLVYENMFCEAADEGKDILGYQGYGDWSFRSTNIYESHYDLLGGWFYNKVFIEKTPSGERLPIRPYINGVIALSSHTKPWENNFVYGAGIEKYIFEDLQVPEFLYALRGYTEYEKITYVKDEAENWVPDHDWRVGIDLYKDYGIGKDKTANLGWSEIWANLAYNDTNFFMDNYRSVVFGTNIKLGLRYRREANFSLMPYLTTEASLSGRDFFWQNRGLAGIGLRVMPFQKEEGEWLNKFKLYAEWVKVVGYFKDNPVSGTPGHDLKIGVSFSTGLWR